MKIKISELIESVKDELLCYEEAGEKMALQWEKEFKTWLRDEKQLKKDVIRQNGEEYFRIKDEDEIFEIAASYLDALEEGGIKKYWKEF